MSYRDDQPRDERGRWTEGAATVKALGKKPNIPEHVWYYIHQGETEGVAKALKPTKAAVLAYRGIGPGERLPAIGKTGTLRGLTSTSLSRTVAEGFARDNATWDDKHGRVIKIRVPKGARAFFIGNRPKDDLFENELLLGKHKFRRVSHDTIQLMVSRAVRK
jgi:hypothetical protein